MRPSDDARKPDTSAAPPVAEVEGGPFELFRGMLGRDMLRYLPSVAVPAVVGVLFVTIFTRVFDPDAFGRYSVVFVSATLLTHLFGIWMKHAVVRYLPRYAERDIDSFTAMLAALLSVLLGGLLVLFALAYVPLRGVLGEYHAFYVPGVAMVLARIGFLVLKSVFQAKLQSKAYSRAEVLFSLSRLGLALVFVFYVARSPVSLIAGPALAYALLFVAMIPWQRIPSAIRRRPGEFRLALAPTFLRYGVPMIGWAMGWKVLETADRYIIEYFHGPGEVGLYSANYSVASMAIWIVASPVLLAAHPLIMNSWERGGRSRIQELITNFSRYYLLGAVPVAVFAGVFARDVSGFLLGEEFHEGYIMIPVVVTGLLTWNFGFYGHKALKVHDRTGVMFALVSACALTNIAVNFVLVPPFGYMGAAVAVLLSSTLYPVLVYIVTSRFLPWRIPWRAAGRIVLSAGVAGVAAWLLGSVLAATHELVRIGAGALVGGVIYLGMLAATRELSEGEREFLRGLAHGRRS